MDYTHHPSQVHSYRNDNSNNFNRPKCPNCFMSQWKQNMFRMATDQTFHDISFIIGNDKTQSAAKKISCNKALLSIHSPVFEAMFKSNMLEQSERVVRIPDIAPAVFVVMLTWMSTNTLNIQSICSLDELIKLADKYQIDALLQSSIYFMRHNTITIHLVTDDILSNYHGPDLGLTKNLKSMSIKLRILSYSSTHDVAIAIAKKLHWNARHVELWRISNRKNGTTRPNRYLCPLIAPTAKNCSRKKRKRGNSKQENHNHSQPLTTDEDALMQDNEDDDEDEDEDDDDDDDDDVDRPHVQVATTEEEDDDDEQRQAEAEDAAEPGDGDDAFYEYDTTANLFNISNMQCNHCYRRNQALHPHHRRHSDHKDIDWTQYSGDNPSKAIYARMCAKNCKSHHSSKQKEKEKHKKKPSTAATATVIPASPSHSQSQSQSRSRSDSQHSTASSPNGLNKHYDDKILLFLKYYDIYHEYLSLVGSILVDRSGRIESICSAIRELQHWSEEHEFVIYEEEDYKAANKINLITDYQQSIADASLVDGDIIVYQSKTNIKLQLMSAKMYLNTFRNKGGQKTRNNQQQRGGGGGGGAQRGNSNYELMRAQAAEYQAMYGMVPCNYPHLHAAAQQQQQQQQMVMDMATAAEFEQYL